MEQMQAPGPTRSYSVAVVPRAVPAVQGQNLPVPGNEGEVRGLRTIAVAIA